MTEQELIENGYRKYTHKPDHRDIYRMSDYILQRRILEGTQTCYFITIYCYHYGDDPATKFLSTAQVVNRKSNCRVNGEMMVDPTTSIETMEQFFHDFWSFNGKIHYED